MGDQMWIPRVEITFVFSSLSKVILVTPELPVLCNIFFWYLSSILFRSFRHVIHLSFTLLYKQKRDATFEFSWILLSVDRPEHLITTWIIIRKFWYKWSIFLIFNISSVFANRVLLTCAPSGKKNIYIISFYIYNSSCEHLFTVNHFRGKILGTCARN